MPLLFLLALIPVFMLTPSLTNQGKSPPAFANSIQSRVITTRVKLTELADQNYQKANNYALATDFSVIKGMPPSFAQTMSIGTDAVGLNGNTRWVCFLGDAFNSPSSVFYAAKAELGANAVLGRQCGLTTGNLGVIVGTVALTYWYTPLTAPAPVNPPNGNGNNGNGNNGNHGNGNNGNGNGNK